ncbi:Phosphatidylserine synthase [Seminavis robusta]|uniref:Phosphatidylserine synthase n=1 Tax=Seminavis robusta TaxID=568900 RepID=A0A9N8HM23_9STRA|nr:Phosphatidylserine synthase [Seminavis robusta]|eukprot:Sro871_g213860.1 Phosphatidylserine synthase (379) ;mRNA; r:34940-36076
MAALDAETSTVLEGLHRLAVSLKELESRASAKLGHYQDIPNDIQQSYEYMQQGASLVHATSTKYTLVGKLSPKDAAKVAQDLLKGCQLIATGALVISNDAYGCARSTRHYTNQAARSIIMSVIQLVQALNDPSDHKILEKDNNLAAQKCGAVWQTCDNMTQKEFPRGNRNATRRELLTWMTECKETMHEFQEMIDRGQATGNNNDDNDPQQDDEENMPTFEEFLCQMAGGDGDDEHYTAKELELAKPAVALIKCSRGSMNVVLKACESASKHLGGLDSPPETTNSVFCFLQKAHDLARVVAEGMTDLGALLYPTISEQDVARQGAKQTQSITTLLDYVLDSATQMELNEETVEMAFKIRSNVDKRHKELQAAIELPVR